jgi:decaprenyl-phosphate phosphoribosyltransferase
MKKYFKLIRIEQYIKNIFVFAPLFFGKAFLNLDILLLVCISFISFCLASSSIYILNDIYDVKEDKMHPEKSKRPYASGEISKNNAVLLKLCLLSTALLISFLISKTLFFIISCYVILNFFYTKWLKHITILDVNIISVGFVLRILAGATVSGIEPSVWILLLTYLLALFLGIAKRRTDVVLSISGKEVRKNIQGYNLSFIDAVLGILASIIIVCYIFYCISPENEINYNSKFLYLSIIFVINGIFRYLKLAIVDQSTYSPTKLVLKDRFLQIIIFSWVVLMSFLLYFNS